MKKSVDSEGKKKKKGIGGSDEEAAPIRQEVRKFIEGKFVTVLMTTTTFFALFGDDMRVWMTSKNIDSFFFIAFIASMFLFGVDLLIQSCVKDDFKYSFFFWLDFVATVSLLLDIPWIWDWF